MSDTVKIAVDGDIATITIARPEKRNALDAATAEAIATAVEDVGRRARVVIITGEGSAFCAGGDLEELERWSELDLETIANTLYSSFQRMIRGIRGGDAVFIAAIDGAAVGAGMDLALACDLRVATERARFGEVWVRLGVIPGTGGAWLTQELAGRTKAAELLFTGDLIDANEALAAGLINRVVAPDALLEETEALTQRVLRHPRDGVIAIKRAFSKASESHLEEALAHAAEVQPQRFTSDEFKAAVRAARAATAKR